MDKLGHWRNSSQQHRRAVTAVLEIEPSLRRVKRYRETLEATWGVKATYQSSQGSGLMAMATSKFSTENRIVSIILPGGNPWQYIMISLRKEMLKKMSRYRYKLIRESAFSA